MHPNHKGHRGHKVSWLEQPCPFVLFVSFVVKGFDSAPVVELGFSK